MIVFRVLKEYMGERFYYHEVRKSSELYRLLNTFIGAYNRRTDVVARPDSSQVIEAINNLSRKVDLFMATQEERLQTIQGQLTSIADGINTLQQQLADLRANNPALDDEIAAIEATVTAIRDDLNPPVPEPAPEG